MAHNRLTICLMIILPNSSNLLLTYGQESPTLEPCSQTSQPTLWMILFIIAVVAFLISTIAHAIVCYRHRKLAKEKDELNDYVIRNTCTANFATQQSKIAGNPPADDYEKPIPTLKHVAAGSKEGTSGATPVTGKSSNTYKEVTVIGSSVQDRRSMFENPNSTTLANSMPASKYDIDADIKNSTEAQLAMRSATRDANQTAGGDTELQDQRPDSTYEIASPTSGKEVDRRSLSSLPDDMAPMPYEKVNYKESKCSIM